MKRRSFLKGLGLTLAGTPVLPLKSVEASTYRVTTEGVLGGGNSFDMNEAKMHEYILSGFEDQLILSDKLRNNEGFITRNNYAM